MGRTREDDFINRRKHLEHLSEQDLEKRFWDLLEEIVDPMMTLASENTTPSIERSVLLRMGFSSLEANAIVQKVMDNELMGKGAGHVVYYLSKEKDVTIREAGLLLAKDHEESWKIVKNHFKGGAC